MIGHRNTSGIPRTDDSRGGDDVINDRKLRGQEVRPHISVASLYLGVLTRTSSVPKLVYHYSFPRIRETSGNESVTLPCVTVMYLLLSAKNLVYGQVN